MTTINSSSSPSAVSNYDTESAQRALHDLIYEVKTAVLGSTNRSGAPDASYAPYVVDGDGNLLIYISALAKHTGNIKLTRTVSVMVIEDEASAATLYARKRATWTCEVDTVERDTEAFDAYMDLFRVRFGEVIDGLSQMKDFTLFQLKPTTGRLVLGFGAAFKLNGWKVDDQVSGRHKR